MVLKPQPSAFTLIEQPFIRGKRLRGAHRPRGQNAPMTMRVVMFFKNYARGLPRPAQRLDGFGCPSLSEKSTSSIPAVQRKYPSRGVISSNENTTHGNGIIRRTMTLSTLKGALARANS